MSEYFNPMSGLDKVYLFCALVGGLLFFIRTVLLLAGLGGHMDGDLGGHMTADVPDHGDAGTHHTDSDASFKFLTIQSLMAFLMMFGLVGLSSHGSLRIWGPVSILIATAGGVASVWLIDRVMRTMLKLQSTGTVCLQNAVGQEGTVYLTIPAEGVGKIQVTFQGRYRVCDATSHAKEEIKTGERVLVVDVANNVLVVEKY
ncbi:NfeD family protein [Candidatus Sumerlaeota bacterium]|nr:NfeD family protein [Candidatus Sumerlaeota bacterium]